MIRNEKGQSLVEMALLLPILVILLVGILDFGRVLYTNLHLQLAAQEIVRVAGLGADDQEIRDFANGFVQIKNTEDLILSISPEQSERASGEYVTISMNYPMEIMTPFISEILPAPINIRTESTIRIE